MPQFADAISGRIGAAISATGDDPHRFDLNTKSFSMARQAMSSNGATAGDGENAIPGPSNYQDRHVTGYAEIPSYGTEFFEYRRRLFLANLPLPNAFTSQAAHSATYRIPLPIPEPVPSPPNAPAFHTSIGRLEALLSEEGAEETMAVWTGGLAMVHEKLTSGKRLSRPLRLGLVIKVLKAGWIKDGTWPIDPATSRAARPPDSPFLGPIPPLRTTSLVPGAGSDDQLPNNTCGDGAAAEEGIPDLLQEDAETDQAVASHDRQLAGDAGASTGERRTVGGEGVDAADVPPAPQRIIQQREAIIEELMDECRDMRIGDNLWRGAQADSALPSVQ